MPADGLVDSPRPEEDGWSGPCVDLENPHAGGPGGAVAALAHGPLPGPGGRGQRHPALQPVGVQEFGGHRMADLVLRRVDHVVVFSDDSDFISLHVHILEMNGESYRIKHSRQNAASQAPDGAWAAPATVLIPPACLLHSCMGDILPEQLARTLALTNGLGGALLLRPTGPTSHRP